MNLFGLDRCGHGGTPQEILLSPILEMGPGGKKIQLKVERWSGLEASSHIGDVGSE